MSQENQHGWPDTKVGYNHLIESEEEEEEKDEFLSGEGTSKENKPETTTNASKVDETSL